MRLFLPNFIGWSETVTLVKHIKTSLLRLTTNLSLDVFIGFLLIKVRTRLFDLSPKYDIGKSNHFRVLILLLAFCEENSTLLRTRKIKTQQAIPSKPLSYLYRIELLFFTTYTL